MGLIVKDKLDGGNYEPIPAGMHQAVCYGVYDLGTQHDTTWDKDIHKVLIQWELPDVWIDLERDGEKVNLPRAISKQYTHSLHEKSNLRKDLESWRGRPFTALELEGFDLTKLLGVNCSIQVMHKEKNDRTYANITAIVPLMAAVPKKTPENEPRYYSFSEGGPIPPSTPEWICNIIMESKEWMAEMSGGMGASEDNPPPPVDDDIPF